MSDSYIITPLNPKVTNNSTFDISYISPNIPFKDDASYNLINTSNSDSIISVTNVINTSTSTALPFSGTTFCIHESVFDTSQIYINNDGVNTGLYAEGTFSNISTYTTNNLTILFGMVTDGSKMYMFTAPSGSAKLVIFNSSGIESATTIGTWINGCDYCPNDGLIYGVKNDSNGTIYTINPTTYTLSIFKTISGSTSGLGGLVFNSDFSYMYVTERSTGNIYYVQRTNPTNTGLLFSLGATTFGIGYNRDANIIYLNSPSNTHLYYSVLTSSTTAQTPVVFTDLSGSSYALRYSNTTKKLYVVDSLSKVYTYYANPLSFANIPTNTLKSGTNLLQIQRNGVNFGDQITVNATCFLEGTRILCLTEFYEEEYIDVKFLKKGMLIKTYLHGYKKIQSIGKKILYNTSKQSKTVDRLYKLNKSKDIQLIDDLIITGNHCVLFPELSEQKREEVLNHMGDIYITDDQYRVPACLDDRFEPFDECGNKTIWHFALENDNEIANYGVYANGLLVETCSIRYINDISNLELQ